jgi:hypothetical protein
MNQELFIITAQLKEAHDKLHVMLPRVNGQVGSKVNESLMDLQRVIMALEEANKD